MMYFIIVEGFLYGVGSIYAFFLLLITGLFIFSNVVSRTFIILIHYEKLSLAVSTIQILFKMT